MSRNRRTLAAVGVVLAAALAGVLPATPAAAVNANQNVIVSDDPANWTPHVLDGRVNSIVQIGNKVIAGGTFTQVQASTGGPILTRLRVFAFDAQTGAIDPNFAPAVDAVVNALAPGSDGSSVFVGGAFNNVNGASARKLVKLSIVDGQRITAFSANADAAVRDLVVSGNRLYVAGSFVQIKQVARSGVAAVDMTTGAVDNDVDVPFTVPRKGAMSVLKIDVTPDGSRLVAIGNFTMVAGQPRNQLAMLDVAARPAVLANWRTDRYVDACSSSFDTYMRDVDFSPNGAYFVVVTTGAYFANRLCDTAARWETNLTGSGLQPTWVNYTGGDTLYSVAVTGTVVYIGGHQRFQNNSFVGDRAGPGAVSREGIAALDPVNGVPFSWNPGRTRGVGAFALLATPSGLWVGSDTEQLGGEYHARIGMFPVAGGTSVPPAQPGQIPGTLYNVELDGDLMQRGYDGTTFGAASQIGGIAWSASRGAFLLSNGTLYQGWDDGRFYARSFDGATAGPAAQISLLGLEARDLDDRLRAATGMFFTNGRWYYTVAGDPRLYYRYFTAESRIIGADEFVASGSGDGLNWSGVQGMTMANDAMYYATADGRLWRIAFAAGRPVPGTAVQVGGPGIDAYNWRSRALFLAASASPDTTPPSVPGKPSGASLSSSSINVSWPASNDDRATTLTYRVYRDGGAAPVGTVTTDSTTTITFTDTGLAAGSVHTYRVDASDGLNVSALSQESDPITVNSDDTVFTDDFSTGNFSRWSAMTGMTIDAGAGGASPPSARGAVTGTIANATKGLGTDLPTVCFSMNVNLSTPDGNSVDLFRLRTAQNGPVARMYVASNRMMFVRSDVSGLQTSAVQLPTGWHGIELCGTVGTAGTWDLYLDGTQVVAGWTADTGTTPVSRVQIGDTKAKTWTANFDDVVVDSSPA